MLTDYDIRQAAQERRQAVEMRYAHENAARRRARLAIERSGRRAARLDAYIAKRERELSRSSVAIFDDRSNVGPFQGCGNRNCGACSVERSTWDRALGEGRN